MNGMSRSSKLRLVLIVDWLLGVEEAEKGSVSSPWPETMQSDWVTSVRRLDWLPGVDLTVWPPGFPVSALTLSARSAGLKGHSGLWPA